MYLQFRPYIQPDRQADASIGALGYAPPAVRRNLASFLTGYRRWFYVPGPVFAGGLVLALTGLTAAGTSGSAQGCCSPRAPCWSSFRPRCSLPSTGVTSCRS
jgi:hypothetical protein